MDGARGALALAALAGSAAIGCTAADELSILIEAAPEEVVTVDEPVATNLAVAKLGQEVDAQRGQRTALDRDVGPNAPFRLAVGLAASGQYAVHIDVIRGDAVWSATRCVSVTGVLRLSVTLVRGEAPADADADGWTAASPEACGEYAGGLADCDDADPLTHPFAYDVCGSGADEDCVGGDQRCSDLDGDGAGDEIDCDDADDQVHPGATEDCDPDRDLDCDGEPRCDEDGDRFLRGDDCDDEDPAIHPGAPELCDDEVDSDCSGDPSNGCVEADQDADGHVAREAGGDDCSDCDPAVSPAAIERCGDGVDQDCDGSDTPCLADDADGDGAVAIAAGGTDCDDADPAVHPGAPEACDAADDVDCDGRIGTCEGGDADGDGWAGDDDCNDGDDAVHPAAAETCNDVDDDCDGAIDEPANCISFQNDAQNCGGCWVQCIGRCDGEECRCGDGPDCEPGEVCCGDGCAELASDEDNCGACGLRCREGETCAGGTCRCGSGARCEGDDACCDDQCVDLDDDTDNCGACGLRCGFDVPCQYGLCYCPGSWGGVDLMTDGDHCGRCEENCDERCYGSHPCEECIDGECVSRD